MLPQPLNDDLLRVKFGSPIINGFTNKSDWPESWDKMSPPKVRRVSAAKSDGIFDVGCGGLQRRMSLT